MSEAMNISPVADAQSDAAGVADAGRDQPIGLVFAHHYDAVGAFQMRQSAARGF